jgi:hypothetical protein
MKKIISFFSVMILLSLNTAFCQFIVKWQKYTDIPDDYVVSNCEMAVDSSGNVYKLHTLFSYDTQDFKHVIVKIDTAGNVLWKKYLCDDSEWESNFYIHEIEVDPSGNVYISISLLCRDDRQCCDRCVIIKFNSDGVFEWEKYSCSGDYYSLMLDKEGNIYATLVKYLQDDDFEFIESIILKYNSDGNLLWSDVLWSDEHTRWDKDWAMGSNAFWPYSVTIDSLSNIYVSGPSVSENDNNYHDEHFTVKYDSAGSKQWLHKYKPSGFWTVLRDVYVDRAGNVYYAGAISYESYQDDDLGVIKITSEGAVEWENSYESDYVDDWAEAVAVDDSGNVYVVGNSGNNFMRLNNCKDGFYEADVLLIAYSPSGQMKWTRKFSENESSWDYGANILIGSDGMIYVMGYTANECDVNYLLLLKYDHEGNLLKRTKYRCGDINLPFFIHLDYTHKPSLITDNKNNIYAQWGNGHQTIKFSESRILNPGPYEKWIAGETDPLLKDTLLWTTAAGWDRINVKLVLDFGTRRQRIFTKARNISGAYSGYIVTIPDTLVSFRTKFLLENAADTTQRLYSDIFRLKPYLLTRVGEDSIYYPYRKDLDQWGFWNNEADMWPSSWWKQFNYKDTDPFTHKPYPPDAGRDHVFTKADSSDYPDWVSWVNAFTINACYRDVATGIYNENALDRWDAWKKRWRGSCVGIAVSNALVFNDKMSFTDTYSSFPSFIDPVNVYSTDKVKEVIHELQVHQFGNQHMDFWKNYGSRLTPAQTVEELKDMLLEDDISFIRTLSMRNNKGRGAHRVLPYRLSKDINHPEIYYIDIYDNSYPSSENPIIVNTSDWGNQSTWTSPDWPGWGGNKWLALTDPALSYLSDPLKKSGSKQQFEMSDDIIQMFPSDYTEFLITDKSGKVTGFSNDSLVLNIPGSLHIAIIDGSESLPAGFDVPFDSYSVAFRNASDTKPGVYIFTGKKTYHYQLNNAVPDQSDRFYFNDGLSVSNRNTGIKSVDLYSLISESTDDKVFQIRQLTLAQNNSVTSKILDDNKLVLVNYGSLTSYDLCLKYVTSAALQRFEKGNVPFENNSTHIIVPVWDNLADSVLMVLLDKESNGTIDDTLFFKNDLAGNPTGVQDFNAPGDCWLGQNYPNPFNQNTMITWYSPFNCRQTIGIYDMVGRLVTTIVDEYKPSGRHEIEFDGMNLPNGFYFYRLTLNNYTLTKKFLIINH